MKRRLFEDLVVSAAGGRRARGGLGWPVSLTLHAVGVAGLLALPALTTEALPDPPPPPDVMRIVALPAVAPPVVQPVPPVRRSGGGPRRSTAAVTPRRMVSVPTRVPDLPPTPDDETLTIDEPGNVGLCIGNCSSPTTGDGEPGGSGQAGSVLGPGTGILRVGGVIKAPTKIRDARPMYPALAQQIRLQGVVILDCIISTDGVVEEVQILSGPPLLQQAARDAVSQWRYTPTFLNGVPVPVIMTVTVNFMLK